MVDPVEDEYIVTERIAITVYTLCLGGTVTTHDVAGSVGITPNGAWRMLCKLSRVLPLTEDAGRWWLIAPQASEIG